MPLLAARSSCGPFPSPMAEGGVEIEMTEMGPQADAANGHVEMEMKDMGQETDAGSDDDDDDGDGGVKSLAGSDGPGWTQPPSDTASEGHEDDIRSGGNAESLQRNAYLFLAIGPLGKILRNLPKRRNP